MSNTDPASADGSVPHSTNGERSPADNSGLRAYLQRGETRLSTMHRIAGVFMNGAGLLMLAPILFREGYDKIFFFAIDVVRSQNEHSTNFKIGVLLQLTPYLLSIVLIILSLYLLFEDLTKFYYTGHIPGALKTNKFLPVFSLTAISASKDDCNNKSDDIIRSIIEKRLFEFALPHKYDSLEETAEGFGKSLGAPEGWTTEHITKIFGTNKHKNDLVKFRHALNLSSCYNRNLIEEVAKMQVSLVRHNLYLRTLVIRYFKAFILLLSAALMTNFSIHIFSLLEHLGASELNVILSLIGINFLWSLSFLIVRLPVYWVNQISSLNAQRLDGSDLTLKLFHKLAIGACLFGASTSIISFILVHF
ncbi:MAG: hypothetical protein HQL95_03745 [Magnetococcales bacterium]|nr:hypothetical protein [Magnetococcales bacterium]